MTVPRGQGQVERDGQLLLPQPAADEVLRRYADLLRVGRLTLNGKIVSWETDTSTELQLQGFCATISANLKELLPDLADQQPAALRLASYWLLKAVSINYALIEVVLMVRDRVGVLCTIETREEGGGALVVYGVDVRPGPSLRVSLTWSKGDNIVHRDPYTAERKVKGTLASLATEFRLPPDPGSVPAYDVALQLRRSLASKFASRLACGGFSRRNAYICIDEPLSHDGLLDTGPVLPAAAEPREPASDQEAESPAHSASSEEIANPVLWTPRLDALDPPVGQLRVRILRARLAGGDGTAAAEPKPALYVTCTVAGKTERSGLVSSCATPEWRETWEFPMTARGLRGEVVLELFGVDTARGELELLATARVLVSMALDSRGDVLVSEPLSGARHGRIELELGLLPEPAQEPDRGLHGPRGEEDLCLRIQVHAAAPGPTTCALWCSRPCAPG